MGDKVKIYKVCDVSRINRLALPAHPTIASLLEQGKIIICFYSSLELITRDKYLVKQNDYFLIVTSN